MSTLIITSELIRNGTARQYNLNQALMLRTPTQSEVDALTANLDRYQAFTEELMEDGAIKAVETDGQKIIVITPVESDWERIETKLYDALRHHFDFEEVRRLN